ncbi:16S rRNA (cytosine(1402)-N(4))-methyltransferase RsmH [Heliorestis acidaminivorans]|uniref:Ribosomal RNA small subunit methyltransferase H n=1 Tax=Heliorestis acidaminivorans TaxID=553427 RepID=A0A6I0EXL2_9FIRM|nr:16S rRNA (cytosine(1402)-N(4))-methyltransferase RsmH [Heliorestis acidaminivorans]KAB2954529.1 16S rRNA (cytosine(1402)-N(4))-methyltransferase RsmH [Heliorestis acidaminivorans]
MNFHHVPVLLHEVLEYLHLQPEGIYLDGTLGGAGHSKVILQKLQGRGRLIGLDQDREALAAAAPRLKEFASQVTLVQSNFRHLEKVVEDLGLTGTLNGILLDIGVSSHQLDVAERGFSYRLDGPLDMRMNQDSTITAAMMLNEYSEEDLSKIFWNYGEERWGKRIAQKIVNRRVDKPFERTEELVEVIRQAIPAAARQEGGHPAKRIFQALRIAVNDELGALQEALQGAVKALAPGGRIVVITFHSLEDRMVKQFFAEQAHRCICPPALPVCACGKEALLKVLTKKPVEASSEELIHNKRAQSAKLRAAQKL